LSSPLVLAPLAGVSNRPFRLLARGYGASLVYTEMISSEGIIRNHARTVAMMRFTSDEQPVGVQLFGANPEVLGQATAQVVRDLKPDLIDLNFGCPVRKVVNKNGGAAILKDLTLTEDIVTSVVEAAGKTPVTVKMRTGWDESSPVYLEAARLAEQRGVSAVCLHARSRSRGYAGAADWGAIRLLKEAVTIPVIGNGDVRTPEDAERMLRDTGCDLVMIGRAAMVNPMIFAQTNSYLRSGVLPEEPTIQDKMELARSHARLLVEEFGEYRGCLMMRRHLGWYVSGFPGAARLRPVLFQVRTLADIDRIFAEYLAGGMARRTAG